MKFCAVIGSAKIPQFVEANILALRRAFPEIEIVVSDDRSHVTETVRDIARRNDCEFTTGTAARGHFGGDMQCFVDGLAFAKHTGADVCVKLSQRFWILSPVIKQLIEQRMADANLAVMIPGRPRADRILGHKGFSKFPFLTDCVVMRASAMDASWMLEKYRAKFRAAKNGVDSFIEVFWSGLIGGEFRERHHVFQELTDHVHPAGPWHYLRRYQNGQADYIRVARELGMFSSFPLEEWARLSGPSYRPVPQTV